MGEEGDVEEDGDEGCRGRSRAETEDNTRDPGALFYPNDGYEKGEYGRGSRNLAVGFRGRRDKKNENENKNELEVDDLREAVSEMFVMDADFVTEQGDNSETKAGASDYMGTETGFAVVDGTNTESIFNGSITSGGFGQGQVLQGTVSINRTAKCKNCGEVISRDIEAIEGHIEECPSLLSSNILQNATTSTRTLSAVPAGYGQSPSQPSVVSPTVILDSSLRSLGGISRRRELERW